MDPVIYRCTVRCPLHKSCFILKTTEVIKQPVEVLVKCTAQKGEDVKVTIGGDERPP